MEEKKIMLHCNNKDCGATFSYIGGPGAETLTIKGIGFACPKCGSTDNTSNGTFSDIRDLMKD